MNEQPDSRYLAVKAVMMPRDTNPHGTIFGGVLLSYIDQAGAIGARYEIQQRGYKPQTLVTVAMDRVEFHEPVFVGDTVSSWTAVERIGTTSIAVHVTVETERNGRVQLLTQAHVTYVAVSMEGDQRAPTPITVSEG